MLTTVNSAWKLFVGTLLASAFFLFSIISVASVNLQPSNGENITSGLLPFLGEQVNLQTSAKPRLKIGLNPIGISKYIENLDSGDMNLITSLSPDGSKLLSMARSKYSQVFKYSLRIWETNQLSLIKSSESSDPVFFNSNNELLGLHAKKDSNIPSLEIYDYESGATTKTLEMPQYKDGQNYYNVYLEPFINKDKTTMAIHYYLNSNDLRSDAVGLWDLDSGRFQKLITTTDFTTLDFTPDNKYFVITSPDVTQQDFYDIETGKNEYSVSDFSIVKDSKFIKPNLYATTNKSSTDVSSTAAANAKNVNQITLWDIQNKKILQQLKTGSDTEVGDLAYFSNYNVLTTGGYDGTIKFYDLNLNSLIESFNKPEKYDSGSGPKSIVTIRTLPNQDKVAAFYKNGDVKFYQVEIGETK